MSERAVPRRLHRTLNPYSIPESNMITGAHFLLYSADADADRRFLRDTFGFNTAV